MSLIHIERTGREARHPEKEELSGPGRAERESLPVPGGAPVPEGPTGKKYWRSLDQLADKPEFREWVHREFPEGASEMLDGASRRNVLKLMAASFGLAGLTACRRPAEHILPTVKGVEDYIPGQPSTSPLASEKWGVGRHIIMRPNAHRKKSLSSPSAHNKKYFIATSHYLPITYRSPEP